MLIGGSGDSVTIPKIYNTTMGTKFKVISGYPGTADVVLAMERGEVHGIGYYSWSNIPARNPDWIAEKKIRVLFQAGAERHRDLPDVPLATEFALSEDKKQILDLWLATNAIARPFAMPLGVPPERVKAALEAFMAMVRDPQFLADAKKTQLDIDAKDGTFIENLLLTISKTPESIIAAAQRADQ